MATGSVVPLSALPAHEIDRLARRLDATTSMVDGCLRWHGAANRLGYGNMGIRRPVSRLFGATQLTVVAHRVAYFCAYGDIPPGLVLDHLCRVPSCCLPAHLEPVTTAVNIQRGAIGTTTHCRRGHEYPGDGRNPYNGRHRCYVCLALTERARKARNGHS